MVQDFNGVIFQIFTGFEDTLIDDSLGLDKCSSQIYLNEHF